MLAFKLLCYCCIIFVLAAKSERESHFSLFLNLLISRRFSFSHLQSFLHSFESAMIRSRWYNSTRQCSYSAAFNMEMNLDNIIIVSFCFKQYSESYKSGPTVLSSLDIVYQIWSNQDYHHDFVFYSNSPSLMKLHS